MNGKRRWAGAAVLVAVGLIGGCAALSGGRIVDEGRGTLVYRAPADGTVTVSDRSLHLQLYHGHVPAGALVEIDPFNHEIRIDQRVAARPMTSLADEYRITYQESGLEPPPAAPATVPSVEPLAPPTGAPATEPGTQPGSIIGTEPAPGQ